MLATYGYAKFSTRAALTRPIQSRIASISSTASQYASEVATSQPVSRKSRRARRLRATSVAKPLPSSSNARPTFNEIAEKIDIVSKIEDLSRTGLTERVEMPQELLTRLIKIIKARSHSQLEALKQKLVINETESRKFPLDMHKRPIGWTLDRDEQIPPYLYGPQETFAYLAYEMEGVYASLHQVFHQLQGRKSGFTPKSVLDFGAGPGTASWIAKNFYEDSVEKYRIVEPSQAMVDAADVILEGFPGLSVRRTLSEMKKELVNGEKYDLIIASHILSEITNDYERIAVTSALWELLADDGCLVIADRGSTWGSHQVRSARQFILDSVQEEEDSSARIVAPCTHHFECPAAGSTWCHFIQRSPRVKIPRELSAKRWNGHKGTKFSYVVIEKNGDVEASKKEAARTKELSRMLRGPILANRHVVLDLCTPQGELERRSVTKGKSLREVYRAARKAHWGGMWPADADSYNDSK